MNVLPSHLVLLSFLSLSVLLLFAPVLRLNQRLLINAGTFLLALASLLAVSAGIWTVAGGIVEQYVLPDVDDIVQAARTVYR